MDSVSIRTKNSPLKFNKRRTRLVCYERTGKLFKCRVLRLEFINTPKGKRKCITFCSLDYIKEKIKDPWQLISAKVDFSRKLTAERKRIIFELMNVFDRHIKDIGELSISKDWEHFEVDVAEENKNETPVKV